MVRRRGAEEGAVAAIVLDHEQAKEKSRRKKEKKRIKPVQANLQRNQREPASPSGRTVTMSSNRLRQSFGR
jgi:hypothetical protein